MDAESSAGIPAQQGSRWLRSNRRWVLLVAGIVLAGCLWATRYQVRGCAPDGCVLVNRWTGSVTYQRAARAAAR